MDRCPDCGASYALVGRVHNCRPRVVPTKSSPEDIGPVGKREHVSTATGFDRKTYQREYMRDYMRRRRAGVGLKSNVPNPAQ